MITNSFFSSRINLDVEAAARLIEQLAIEAGEAIDRARIRHAMEEAASAWPEEEEDRWWKWMVDANLSLGLKCKVVDCSFEQMVAMCENGAQIVTFAEHNHRWVGLARNKATNYLVFEQAGHVDDGSRQWMSRSDLYSKFQTPARHQLLRCVLIETRASFDADGLSHDESPTPFNRLWGMLKQESSDIWIIIIFSVVTGILALATPMAVETLVNTVAFGRFMQPVVVLAIILLGFLAFRSALRALQTYVVEIIQRRLFARVVADLAYRFPRVRGDALENQDGRELANRFFDVVTVQKVASQLLLDGISLVLMTLIGMSVLAFYHPWLLGFDLVLISMIAFVILILGRGAVESSIKESKHKYRTAAWLETLIGCETTFRNSGAAEFALSRADQLTYEYLTARKKHFRILMRQIVFSLGLQAIASTVLLGLGGWLVINGQLTLGQLVAAELIVTVIVDSFAKLGKHLESFYDALASVDKLGVLFDLPMEHQDGMIRLPDRGPARVVATDLNLHSRSGQSSITHLSIRLDRGDRLVISGPSGSGKSHLLDILYGLQSPSSGHVTIDGFDPGDLRPEALRNYVALVRDVELFAGTVAENVHLQRPEITLADVRDALEQVGLHDELLRLGDGLDTRLIDNGYPLTGNQMRKLMLARAIVGRPTLLMIDQTLDALPDDELDTLMDLLCDPTQPWTLIVVSGRQIIRDKANRTLNLSVTEQHHQEFNHDD